MQVARGDLLAAARFALDQHRVRRIGYLANLHAQQFDFLAGPYQIFDIALAAGVTAAGDDLLFQSHLDFGDIAGLGDKIDRAVLLGLEYVLLVVLARQHQHASGGVHLRNLANHRQSLIGAVRVRRQAEIDQRQRRRVRHLVDQRETRRSVRGALDVVFLAEDILEAVGDNCIIVDQQQCRFLLTVRWHQV